VRTLTKGIGYTNVAPFKFWDHIKEDTSHDPSDNVCYQRDNDLKLFPDCSWNMYSPRGDGLCSVRAFFYSLGMKFLNPIHMYEIMHKSGIRPSDIQSTIDTLFDLEIAKIKYIIKIIILPNLENYISIFGEDSDGSGLKTWGGFDSLMMFEDMNNGKVEIQDASGKLLSANDYTKTIEGKKYNYRNPIGGFKQGENPVWEYQLNKLLTEPVINFTLVTMMTRILKKNTILIANLSIEFLCTVCNTNISDNIDDYSLIIQYSTHYRAITNSDERLFINHFKKLPEIGERIANTPRNYITEEVKKRILSELQEKYKKCGLAVEKTKTTVFFQKVR